MPSFFSVINWCTGAHILKQLKYPQMYNCKDKLDSHLPNISDNFLKKHYVPQFNMQNSISMLIFVLNLLS